MTTKWFSRALRENIVEMFEYERHLIREVLRAKKIDGRCCQIGRNADMYVCVSWRCWEGKGISGVLSHNEKKRKGKKKGVRYTKKKKSRKSSNVHVFIVQET